MKTILGILTFVISTSFFSKNEDFLEGRYIIKFEKTTIKTFSHVEFEKENCTFLNNRFPMCYSKILYSKYLSSFETCDKNIVLDFKTSEIKNDTIKFQVHNKQVFPTSYLHISVDSGLLIKTSE